VSFSNLFRRPVPADKDLALADAILSRHPDLPSVMAEIGDAFNNLQFVERLRSESPGTPERLKLVIEMFNVRARALTRLVNSMETRNAVAIAVRQCAQTAWIEFADRPFKRSDNNDPQARQCWLQITDAVRDWEFEGFRRLTTLSPPPEREEEPVGRGYRDHIRRWMKDSGILTVEEAARALGVSKSTLKSIMSERGEVRYSAQTLDGVLK
jgi:hypothetical protein